MTKIYDDNLRCEICDFCKEVPSLYFDSVTTNYDEDTPHPSNVAVRECGKALCNACHHAQGIIIEECVNQDLTGGEIDDIIVYNEQLVKVYKPSHSALAPRPGVTEEVKEKWRTEYAAMLRPAPTPPGRY